MIVTVAFAVLITEMIFFVNRDLPQYVINHAISLGWTKMNTFFLAMAISSPLGLLLSLFYGARKTNQAKGSSLGGVHRLALIEEPKEEHFGEK